MNETGEKILSMRPSAEGARFDSMDESGLNGSVRSSVVNRTHRVVRERARSMAIHRSRVRSLWIPLTVSSALVVILCSAVWSILEQYDLSPSGLPDASNQFLVLLLWFLPVSLALLALVLSQRARKRADQEAV
jgi:protein-S-isoprenylcysteine O-methyltransferase Ste14